MRKAAESGFLTGHCNPFNSYAEDPAARPITSRATHGRGRLIFKSGLAYPGTLVSPGRTYRQNN